jgi:hypothetical protein
VAEDWRIGRELLDSTCGKLRTRIIIVNLLQQKQRAVHLVTTAKLKTGGFHLGEQGG